MSKRVGIIQSNYIPWRGYFDFINSVDLFIIFDDIQYPRGRSWRNRNQVKTSQGLRWLTVPIPLHSYKTNIDKVCISSSNPKWQLQHYQLLKEAFQDAPFAEEAIAIWESGISSNNQKLSDLNIKLINVICHYLNISTPIVLASDYNASGRKTERLIDLLSKVDATHYLSGQAAKDYLDESLFAQHGICLEYKTYDYEPYPQLWGEFAGNVTILDLIANTGKEAISYITSKSPNIKAV